MNISFRQTIRIVLCFGAAIFCQAKAQQPGQPLIDDAYGDAFVNYQPYIVPDEQKKKAPPNNKPAAPRTNAESKKAEPEKVTVAWLRENYPLLEERAVNDPTEENVKAYLYVKRITMDKAQRFSEKVTEVTNQDPLLNENNRIPYASSGAQAIRNANRNAQGQAVRELSQVGGLVVFVDGECRFCAMQMPVIQMLNRDYGMEALVVSLDGTRPKGYAGPMNRDNGLFRKLGLKLTPSIVYVHRPRGYQNGLDPNEYKIVAQGFYALDELAKQIAYAGHRTKLLSKATMADLDVWDRGVASVEDLNALKLNANDPESIRRVVEPMLLKQY
ncbi:conjugal transfer protein TraF [Herbaspirillum huttiense]|uniref:conjugal transfer protein TraF n=1 Tax=Herbaspirillum huttiense TaxID=863372 RepID=UPI002176AE0D|nr:conjugal transfer protein TraF [Herbaspirillum huttiense]UWE19372.1 conjugal transfer protein TraF [Herbaspirillum huttiense]